MTKCGGWIVVQQQGLTESESKSTGDQVHVQERSDKDLNPGRRHRGDEGLAAGKPFTDQILCLQMPSSACHATLSL